MKKNIFLVSLLLLLFCMTPVTVLADSQSITARYSVPAIVIYKDYDGTSTTQKVDVGTILKAPTAKGKPGCLFEGWKDEKTGLLWDFTTPVTEHMTFIASYSELKETVDGNVEVRKGKMFGTSLHLPKTGDVSNLPGYGMMLILSVTVMVILLDIRKKKKEE